MWKSEPWTRFDQEAFEADLAEKAAREARRDHVAEAAAEAAYVAWSADKKAVAEAAAKKSFRAFCAAMIAPPPAARSNLGQWARVASWLAGQEVPKGDLLAHATALWAGDHPEEWNAAFMAAFEGEI